MRGQSYQFWALEYLCIYFYTQRNISIYYRLGDKFTNNRFDLSNGEVSPSEEKWDIVTKATEGLQTSLTVTPRKLLSFIGILDSCRKNSTNGQITHEIVSVVPKNPLEISPITGYLNSLFGDFENSSDLVEKSKECVSRGTQSPVVHRDVSVKGWGEHLGDLKVACGQSQRQVFI